MSEVETRPAQSMDIRNTGEYVKLRALATKLKQENAVLQTERDQLKSDLATREKELGDARTAVDQNQLLRDNAALKLQIRTDRHRLKFNEMAKEAGVKPNALDDLWEKSGYKADTDEPNPEAMKAAIEAQRQARDYLFAPAATEGDGTPAPQPGPGRGQGANVGNGKWRVTAEQLASPDWMRANRGKLDEAMAKDAWEIVG